MKIENVDGKFVIVLENEEERVLVAKDDVSNIVSLDYDKEGLKVIDKKEIISTINDESVYVLPLQKNLVNFSSKEDNITLCDKWLCNFKKIYDVLEKLVRSQKYNGKNAFLLLNFGRGINNSDDSSLKWTIDLKVVCRDTIVHNGINIEVNDVYVYSYLVANVFEYFFSKSLLDYNIDLDRLLCGRSFCYFYASTSNINISFKMNFEPQIFDDNYYFRKIVEQLINCHNLDMSYSQIIEETKHDVSKCSGYVSMFEETIENSDLAVKNIMTLKKTKNR